MILDKDYILNLRKEFINNKILAGAMGKIVPVKMKKVINNGLRILFRLQREAYIGKFTFSGMPIHPYYSNILQKTDVLNGIAVYRKHVFEKFKFSESLGRYAYMEDCDLSKRVSKNYLLLYVPNAKSWHNVSKLNRDNIVRNRSIYIRNYSYLFFKNFYPENKLRFFGYIWSVIGLFAEAILARNINYLKGYCLGLKKYYFKVN